MKQIFQLLGVQSPVQFFAFHILNRGEKVGEDALGNRYYRGKPRRGYKLERRWVKYKGAPEASMVPPQWHGWLHHQTNEIPTEGMQSFRRPWQKPHVPNMTGTNLAYRPPGHVLEGGRRDRATGDYEAWQPPK